MQPRASRGMSACRPLRSRWAQVTGKASQSSPGKARAASAAASPPDPLRHSTGKTATLDHPPAGPSCRRRLQEATVRNVLRANHCWLSPKYFSCPLGLSQLLHRGVDRVASQRQRLATRLTASIPGASLASLRRSFCLCSISFGIVYRDCPGAILRPHIVFPI